MSIFELDSEISISDTPNGLLYEGTVGAIPEKNGGRLALNSVSISDAEGNRTTDDGRSLGGYETMVIDLSDTAPQIVETRVGTIANYGEIVIFVPVDESEQAA